jgi:hypothetical protein
LPLSSSEYIVKVKGAEGEVKSCGGEEWKEEEARRRGGEEELC